MVNLLKNMFHSGARRLTNRRIRTINAGDYIVYEVPVDRTVTAAMRATLSEDSVVLAPVPFVARVVSVITGPSYIQYQVVRLGAIGLLPRSPMFNKDSYEPDGIDWAKLEDVKWLLDRQQGLTGLNKRKLGRVSKYAEGASPRTNIVQSAWADQHIGSADLPPTQFDRDFVLNAATAIIPARGGLFHGLRAGCWILYHSRGRLYWGFVRNIDLDRKNVPGDRRRVHITTSRWQARLYREEDGTQLPNLVWLLNHDRWTRLSSDAPCYDTAIFVFQIRGIVDARYLRRVTGRRVPNESYLVPSLAKFDYIIAKHPDRQRAPELRYCGGWIIFDPNSQWLKIWTERNESDCVSPIARMNRYYWIPRQDVLRVISAAGVAMRLIEPRREVRVIVSSSTGPRITRAEVATSAQETNFSTRYALRRGFGATNYRVLVRFRSINARDAFVYYERRNVFLSKTMAEVRLTRIESLGDPRSEQQFWIGLLRRRVPDYKDRYYTASVSDLTEP